MVAFPTFAAEPGIRNRMPGLISPARQCTAKFTVPLAGAPADTTVTTRLATVAFCAIVKVAVICVGVTFVTVADTPLLQPNCRQLTATVEPGWKFVPVSVTFTDVPCVPLVGLIEVNVAGATTLPWSELEGVPLAFLTETFQVPPAVLDTFSPTISCVLETTTAPITVTLPVPPVTLTVDPVVKLVPVSVTLISRPRAQVFGVIAVSVAGGSGVTVKVTGAEVPPGVLTVTFRAAGVAVAAIWNEVVICVAELTVTVPTVTPLLTQAVAHETLTPAPATKLVPVRVT
jgi:hypothetical protein